MAETPANRKAFIDSVLIFIKRINVYVMIKYSPLQIQKHKDVKEKPTYMKQYFYEGVPKLRKRNAKRETPKMRKSCAKRTKILGPFRGTKCRRAY
ncbi:hypothetical protein DAPPUDRAFT_263674 [Daphnia pulex]|uniref:Uncharacterized protein n=1 Tax=Daphnia pulex TaxID=6669 RepID=E9HQ76_DAPPU|nr:hypothetical protein DAPPUDRAFT_263674 [Daphnia pulex]|eukprot:EFX66108.1 hypothetical protein DAPPUDRAFT_263674 [Daphnia pulex]